MCCHLHKLLDPKLNIEEEHIYHVHVVNNKMSGFRLIHSKLYSCLLTIILNDLLVRWSESFDH